jgi:uncharacterized membrane protein
MLGMTPYGLVHTLISLVAVGMGIAAFVQDGEISTRGLAGRGYVLLTAASCVTGFFIFHHGGFGKPHALGILTLLVLAVAFGAENVARQSAAMRYIAALAYSLSFFCHVIPGFTETATRLPATQPFVPGPDAPQLQAAIAIAFVIFLVGISFQVRAIRRELRIARAGRPAITPRPQPRIAS